MNCNLILDQLVEIFHGQCSTLGRFKLIKCTKCKFMIFGMMVNDPTLMIRLLRNQIKKYCSSVYGMFLMIHI
jgi:hypothetical protein